MSELSLIVGFLLKPGVLVLAIWSLFLILRLRPYSGAKTLGLSMITFVAGELFCAVDVYFRRCMSLVNEGAHEILMMLSYGLFFVGLVVFSQERYRCWNLSCDQYQICRIAPADCPESSRYGSFLTWLIFSLAVVGIFPLLAPFEIQHTALSAGVGGKIFGSYIYARSKELAVLQQRVFPLLGIAGLCCCGLIYWKKKQLDSWVLWPGGLGLGALAFAYLRLALVSFFYPQAVLTTFSEELLEALFLALLLVGLYSSWPRRRISSNSSSQ